MSTISEIFGGIKKVLLMEDSISRIEQNFERLSRDVLNTRNYAETIDRRVTRLEGFIEGVSAAAGQQARLPKE